MKTFPLMILEKGPVSGAFFERGIRTFNDAAIFIKQLPYMRNKNKTDLLTVFSDGFGTCSTKHALLKLLADEQDYKELELKLGVFKMNGENTPATKSTLDKFGLDYIPEAHMYLRHAGDIIDCTNEASGEEDFVNDLMDESDILPDQLTEYKVDYHRRFLKNWLDAEKNIPYSLDEIWKIREQCIADLAANSAV